MRRREFIGLLGGAAAWPVAVRAQQSPVIGYISSRTARSDASMLSAFHRGLAERGFIEAHNLSIEYRFAEGRYDRVPTLFNDLIERRVSVIAFAGLTTTDEVLRLVRASSIPIVFNTGSDPVRLKLVESLKRPGGNATGISSFTGLMSGKHVGLLHDLVPSASTIAVLVDRSNLSRNVTLQESREAVATLGQRLLVLDPGTVEEIDVAFARLNGQPADAMMVAVSPFFVTRAQQISDLTARYRIPAIFPRREFVEAGGLMSYGYSIADGYREMGRYTGRILNGEKPAELPVYQAAQFEYVVNLKTARGLGLTFPPGLLASVDEVIE